MSTGYSSSFGLATSTVCFSSSIFKVTTWTNCVAPSSYVVSSFTSGTLLGSEFETFGSLLLGVFFPEEYKIVGSWKISNNLTSNSF